jgi:hypothetical protein
MVVDPDFWNWFQVIGDVHMHEVTRKVSVMGHVRLLHMPELTSQGHRMLPYEFDTVTGEFSIEDQGITHLQGCPRQADRFIAAYNPITSLQGGPETVTQLYSVRGCKQLESLDGVASQIHGVFVCDWQPDLPLLRSLVAQQIQLDLPPFDWDQLQKKQQAERILNKHAGTGKSHILLCSNELKKAGLAGNAAW